MKFNGGAGVVKATSDKNLLVIWIIIRPWRRFVLSLCLGYDDCLWIFGGEAELLVDYYM